MASQKSATKAATAKVEEFAAEAQKSVSEGLEKATKGLEDATAFGQETMDAIKKSSEVASKAAEGLNAELSAYSKKSFEEGVAAVQDMAAAKTVTELFEKQAAFAQFSFDTFVKQATKMNEIYSASAKEISAPLADRFTAATAEMKTFTA